MSDNTDDLRARVQQIRRAHASARPKPDNPAWQNSHHDLGIALQYIDQIRTSADAMEKKMLGLLKEYTDLLSVVGDIVSIGNMDTEGLARLRAHSEPVIKGDA